MTSRIVKQPNGKLAHFTSVLDNFTDYNMDRSEAIAFCQNKLGLTVDEAEVKVQRAIDDIDPHDGKTKGSGLDRWNEVISIIEDEHGAVELAQVLAEIGE